MLNGSLVTVHCKLGGFCKAALGPQWGERPYRSS